MADTVIHGTGVIADSDFKYVKFFGTTKSGKTVTIEMNKALCISDPEWTFADKDDTVAKVEFEGCYSDADLATGSRQAPYSITVEDGMQAGASEILLGAGKVYIGSTSADAVCVGLTRGGSSFKVEQEIRELSADGDPGKVAGRVVLDGARPKLTLNALEWVTKISKLYPAMG